MRSRALDSITFTGLGRRFELAIGGPPGIATGHALGLVRRVLAAEALLERRLCTWYRRSRAVPGLETDRRLLALLLRDIETGRIRLHERGRLASYGWEEVTDSPDVEPLEPLAPEPLAPDEPSEHWRVEYLAIGDFNFATGRALLLPGPSRENRAAGDQAEGLALIAGLLAHLVRVDRPRRVLVAGHTDAAGSIASNIELSERRAVGVRLACDGDAEGFADHALANATLTDAQELLRWIATRFGWGCDPGPIDGIDGPRTAAGRDGFRARAKAELDVEPGAGPSFERADYLALFRLYEQDLAARLGVTPSMLSDFRARLRWTEPAVIGCGEHWPEHAVRRSCVNRDDRRVELLCFEPRHLPAGPGAPPGASIYDDPRWQWTPIHAGPRPHQLEGPCFELALPCEDLERGFADASVRLRGGFYELRHAVADAKRRGDFRVFHFHGVGKGIRYAAALEPRRGEAIELFTDVSLDSYILGIGDEAELPEPIPIHIPRQPEIWQPDGPYVEFDPDGDDAEVSDA